MSKLLLDEHPLMVMPNLAKKIGLNEALILQQIHYWNEINKKAHNNFKDGHYWTFNSYDKWQEQFPFWGKRTIQRTIQNLEKIKLVIVGNYNKLKIDRTKWYRVDYEALRILESSPFSQIGTSNMTEWLQHLDEMTLPLPETNTETNAETTPKRYTINHNGGILVSYYASRFKEHFNRFHPTVTKEQLADIEYLMDSITSRYDLDDRTMFEIIDYHFDNLPSGNDGKIFAFLGENEMVTPIIRYADDVENYA